MPGTRGKWVLVDYLNKEEPGLLSIGDTNFSGTSLRKNLDPLARELLFDRFRMAVEDGSVIDEQVSLRGEAFRVHVEPLFTPMTGNVLAALGVYLADGDLPERPLVGALEWKIPGDGLIETAWNNDLFAIYEIPRNGQSSPTGDMARWVSELIAAEDRPRMKFTIDNSIQSSNNQRYLVPYRIITRSRTNNPGSKNLEVSGRVINDPKQAPLKWLRAITREVREPAQSITPGFEDHHTGSLLRAVFELTQDRALMAVDVDYWQTFMTSPSWTEFSLESPKAGYLPHIIHPDDNLPFRDLVQEGLPSDTIPVRFLHTDGRYRPYVVSVSSGHGPVPGNRYVICSLKPAGRD